MLKVLVVEDEELIRRGIVLAVDWAALGCVVVGEASNGEEALEAVERLNPSLIITDLKMPRMDGIEMLRRLRERGNNAYVIILTAYDSFEYAQSALRLGAVDFLLKPFHDGDLERMCGVPGRVAEKTAEELAALRLAGSEEHIPLLEEVLPLFAGRAPLVVELKTDRHGAAALARDTVDCLDRFSIDYCVESFDPRPLRWLRRHRPSVLRGQLSQNFHRHPSGQGPWNRLALTNLFYNAFTRPDFVAYRFGDREKPAVRLCRKFGMRMAYWTLRSRADVALAEQEGALPIFEEPDRPKEVTH